MIYENLFDDSMNSSVALMIALFDSIGNPKRIKKDAFSKISGYVWKGP